jgi:hypothetical protein
MVNYFFWIISYEAIYWGDILGRYIGSKKICIDFFFHVLTWNHLESWYLAIWSGHFLFVFNIFYDFIMNFFEYFLYIIIIILWPIGFVFDLTNHAHIFLPSRMNLFDWFIPVVGNILLVKSVDLVIISIVFEAK